MLLAPFENFYIVTKLKPEQVQTALTKEVGRNETGFFRNPFSSPSSGYFLGFVVPGTFELRPNIIYQNSFIPQIKGSTEAWLNGSRVHVKMKMRPLVTAFMCMWLGFALVASIVMLVDNINNPPLSAAKFMPWAMVLFGYVLATGGFKFESIKAKAKLLEVLDGEVEEKQAAASLYTNQPLLKK